MGAEVKVEIQRCYTTKKPLPENRYLETTLYDTYWFTFINMSLIERGNPISLKFKEKKHFNFERIMPDKWAEPLVRKSINKQSQEVAGIDLVDVFV